MALIPLIRKLLLYEDLLLAGKFGMHLFLVLYEWAFINLTLFLSVILFLEFSLVIGDVLLCNQIYSSLGRLILLILEF